MNTATASRFLWDQEATRKPCTIPSLAFFFLIGSLLLGCSPMGGVNVDEQKDPHFLAGKSRAASMDYEGAVASYEKALQNNPSSASAHLELGLLCESEHLKDYSAAIYHFEKHLKLRPNSNVAEEVRRRIHVCQQELAKSVSFALVNQLVNAELERLRSTNAILSNLVGQLRAQVSAQAAELAHQDAPAIADPPGEPITPEPRRPIPSQSNTHDRSVSTRNDFSSRPLEQTRPNPGSAGFARGSLEAGSNPRTTRSHVVRPGETVFSIARRYGVSVDQIRQANPGLNPRKIKVGQTIQIRR